MTDKQIVETLSRSCGVDKEEVWAALPVIRGWSVELLMEIEVQCVMGFGFQMAVDVIRGVVEEVSNTPRGSNKS